MMSSVPTRCLGHVVKLAAAVCLLALCQSGVAAQQTRAREPRPSRPLGEEARFEARDFSSAFAAQDAYDSGSASPAALESGALAPSLADTTHGGGALAIDDKSASPSATPAPASAETTGLVTEPADANAEPAQEEAATPSCTTFITANVVAFDQVYTYNRFGAFNPGGMIYALKRDVVPITPGTEIAPGNVQLRPDKRPRPIVLRVNEGDCLRVTFQNLLTPDNEDVEHINFKNQPNEQPYTRFPIRLRANDTTITRAASMHVNGLDYVNGPDTDDGANVGNNTSSLAAVGQTRIYTWYAAKPGQYLLFSMGAPSGNEGDNGQGGLGLFGSVNVEPRGARWYRSQVTAKELEAVTVGNNPNKTPRINYEAVDANGRPILNMRQGNEIIHTDVNAIITGFVENCAGAPPSGTCGKPFREFTVLFHDELKAVQAFSKPNSDGDPVSPLDDDLFHGVRDGFGVNYGASGLGAMLIANRARLGPAAGCDDCKFEEFFLESWVNGDPAMVMTTDQNGRPNAVLFPDDPSNVHHSYLNDPVRFRNLHIGAETHVFHLHAHQWLQTPRDENSTYLDSQTISPGGSFTYEINYGGSGNRNRTPGDAIFHCHLYPHFAQGMWELWRVHDVFESGTADRRLPDAEIGWTPTPAIIPLPDQAMPPMPTDAFRGFPFYVAGVPGHRPPQPPLDFATNSGGQPMDGGLPRHLILDAVVEDGPGAIAPALLQDPVAANVLAQNNDPNLLAFARELEAALVQVLPSDGTDAEKRAMSFHEGCLGQTCAPSYPSWTPTGLSKPFVVNGLPRKPGAPFADPCVPQQTTATRTYAAAYIQFKMTVNRAGWHDRQARITTLEDDAIPTRDGQRQPEPFYVRARSGECVVFKATNLVPKVLNLDDFQIFTPTDTIGQHIHLVKFDVTSSDGAGNGWNYEDGTFSPGEVQERIHANNKWQEEHGGTQFFELKTNPKFGAGPDLDRDGVPDYLGAQTTVQRWWADPLLNTRNFDRTIRTVFTHDHFGPSSHQHHGLYGALVVEKRTANWTMLDGSPMNQRADGGPTSFAANILDGANSFREFNLAFADFAIVYRPDLKPVNPPGRKKVDLPIAIQRDLEHGPQPEAISADDPGTQLVNYRNEPIPHRVAPPDTTNQYPVGDPRGDLANVFSSQVHGDPFTPVLPAYEKDQTVIRLIQGAQEEQHVFNLHGYKWFFQPGTPEDPQSVNNSGYRNGQQIGISEHFEFYLNQPPPPNPPPGSAFGRMTPTNVSRLRFTDHLYSSAATDNLWDGQWGILRVIANNITTAEASAGAQTAEGRAAAVPQTAEVADAAFVPDPGDPSGQKTIALARLPNNPKPASAEVGAETTPAANDVRDDSGDPPVIPCCEEPPPPPPPVCPVVNRAYKVTAILARDLLPGGQIVYNQRAKLVDPNAIMLVEGSNIDLMRSGVMPAEPLILRANAGDCIEVTLTNELPVTPPENNSWNLMPMIVERFNFNQVRTSNRVGLHSQLVAVNTFLDDGAFVGYNPDSTIGPGGQKTYRWYAGDRYTNPSTGAVTLTPIEFGASGLRDMGDVIKHSSHGSIGSLIIEPPNTYWRTTRATDAQANIYDASTGAKLFREFVVMYQTDLSLQQRDGGLWEGFLRPLRNMADEDDSEDSGMKAFNYRTEPLWARLGVPITTPPIGGPEDPPGTQSINDFDLKNILSSRDPNPGCGGPCGDPETPLFYSEVGLPVRWRVLDVAGHPRQHGFTIFGHHWNFEPWQQQSRVQGENPRTFEIGSESGIGPTRHVNILTRSGGLFRKTGDYLYRTQEAFQFTYGGLWGIFRVGTISASDEQ